ncbi:MAG: hypothetical protein R6T89_02995 [Candidatus Syntrophosphaera sp.]
MATSLSLIFVDCQFFQDKVLWQYKFTVAFPMDSANPIIKSSSPLMHDAHFRSTTSIPKAVLAGWLGVAEPKLSFMWRGSDEARPPSS